MEYYTWEMSQFTEFCDLDVILTIQAKKSLFSLKVYGKCMEISQNQWFFDKSWLTDW